MPSVEAMKIMANKPTRGGAWGSAERKAYLASRRQPTYAETYDGMTPPDFEKVKSWGPGIPVARWLRNGLGMKGREFAEAMRAYNAQYRRNPNQKFINNELLQSLMIYNPYATNNPGGLQRGGGMW